MKLSNLLKHISHDDSNMEDKRDTQTVQISKSCLLA